MARVIDDVDLLDLDLYEFGDPHEAWSRLRNEAPVYWNVSKSGPEFWAITRYADCRRVLDDAATFSSERWGISLMVLEQMQLLQMLQGPDAPPATCVKDFFHVAGELTSSYGAGAEMGLPMIMTDPPRHLQRRRVINKMFTPRAVRDRLGPLIQRFAKQAVDNVIDRGECEFVYDIGHTVPARVTLGLLGVPEDDFDLMTEIEHKMITGSDADLAGEPTGETTFIQQLALTEYFSPLIKERRVNPKDDLISILAHSEVEGKLLEDSEILGDCMLFIAGGLDTTRATSSKGAMLALLENPGEMERLRNDFSLFDLASDEFVRWASPIVHVMRTALRDAEVGGQLIKEGDRVACWLPSANRDEAVFADPFRFDISRTPNDHLAFGHGEHHCIGTPTAKLIIQAEFEQIFTRMKDIELAGEPKSVRSHFVGGLKSLPIRFRAA